MHRLDTTTLIGIAVVLVIIGGLVAALASNREQQEVLSVTNFDECAAAGYPITESYPERCMTPDGRSFTRDISGEPQPGSRVSGGCALAGCSSQLCVEAGEAADIITTCEYRAEYACYQQYGRCERQTNGLCGWTDTPELTQCIAAAISPSAAPSARPAPPSAPGGTRLDSGPPATEY